MDKLTSIKVFRQIVDSGTFAGAAVRLGLSTAAISKHMARLEKRLDVRLLNRNTRTLSLTEGGRVYFERCKSILDDLQATELELGSMAGIARGTLRLTAPNSVSGQWIAGLLAEYRRRCPEVMVDVSFDDRFVDLVEEGYDVALRIVSRHDCLPAGAIARPVRPAVFYLAASREYVRHRGRPSSFEELPCHDFVAVGDLLGLLARQAAMQGVAAPLRMVSRYRSMHGVPDAIAAGIGIGPLPSSVLEDPLFKELLVPVMPDQALLQATMYIVHESRKFVPRKLRDFVDLVLEFALQEDVVAQLPVGSQEPNGRALRFATTTCARETNEHIAELSQY